jgi:hypothetical protein
MGNEHKIIQRRYRLPLNDEARPDPKLASSCRAGAAQLLR